MLTAEVFNRTGHVLFIPRTQISEALKRKESRYTGVYLLLGERDGEPLAYIGEGEDISERIRSHDGNKDWWNLAVLITAAANNLNKAHVKYLEARLVEEARSVGKVTLENGTTPARPGLSEAAVSNMEGFLAYVLMILPALQIDLFVKKTRPSSTKGEHPEAKREEPLFELQTPKHGIRAQARLESGEFVVERGSIASLNWKGQGSENSTYAQLFAELVKMGVLTAEDGRRVFKENYAFKSPSAAAAVVNGRPANGTIEWKVKGQNKTYKEWEAEQLKHDGGEVE